MQGGDGRPPGWPGNPTQPQYGQPQQPQYGQPQQPQYAQPQPQQPQYAQPQPPQYAQPQQPQYAQPPNQTQQQFGQPQYAPQQPQYAQPQQPQYGQPQQGAAYAPPQGFPPVMPANAPASLSGPQPAISREEAQKSLGSLHQDHRGSVPMGTLVWTAWIGSAIIAMTVGFSLVEDFFNGAKMAAGSAAIGQLIGCTALQRRQRWGAMLMMLANVVLLADAGLSHRGDAAFVMIVWILALGALIAPRWDALT